MREAQTLRAARRAGLHKRMTAREDSGCEEAPKTGDTTRVGAGICRRFTLVRASGVDRERQKAKQEIGSLRCRLVRARGGAP